MDTATFTCVCVCVFTHLWTSRVCRVVKIIVLHREEGVGHRNRKSCETQRLEVIDLLHQPWKHTREQRVTHLPWDEEEEEECVLPLDRKSLPTQTSGATTVTLSTAMALRKT